MLDIEIVEATDLELEVLCPVCNGAGNAPGPVLTGPNPCVPCLECGGKRWILTELGRGILDLVRRYETRVRPADKAQAESPDMRS